MRQMKLAVACVWTLTLLLSGAPGNALQPDATAAQASAAKAMDVLQQMADFLSQATRFSVTIDIGFDVVQDFGQKIEFGETRRVVLRRPNHFRVDTTARDGSKSGLVFDGQTITVFHVDENVYATTAVPGSIDQAVAHFVQDLEMRLPLAELMNSQLSKSLLERVRVADYVEPSSIAGVPCDHLALRGDEADLQLWIAQGQQPLPQRAVITYRSADGRPQFWAQFSNWNLTPDAPDALFAYTPAPGAVKIAVSPRQVIMSKEPASKGGQ